MTKVRPYHLSPSELDVSLEGMVAAVFGDLTSQFLLMPRGPSLVEYPDFLVGYEALRVATDGFRDLSVERCWAALKENSVAFLVLRTIIGLSPPEWVDLAKEEREIDFPLLWARKVDGEVKRDPRYFTSPSGTTAMVVERTSSLLAAACRAISAGAGEALDGFIHRLDKCDTQDGLQSVQHVAQQHVPYAVLLYERFLGRPFASHRDSVSELVGDVMESAIEGQLADARIPFRKTRRAERVPGFDQAPDFFVPDEFAPAVIIEAKITGDDGTARDKVARILRLASMRDERMRQNKPTFQVVACIDGRGFGV